MFRIGTFSRTIAHSHSSTTGDSRKDLRRDRPIQSGAEKALVSFIDANPKLDLLICAGSAIAEGPGAARAVVEATLRTGATVALEQDSSSQRKRVKPKKGRGLRWIEAGEVRAVAKQEFVHHSDDEEAADRALTALEGPTRRATIKGRNVLWMNCGELNLLKANYDTKEVVFRFPRLVERFQQIFDWADIIVNPTHTRMARRFVIDYKAAAISAGKLGALRSKPKTFVHVSNYVTGFRGARSQRPESLQTIWIAGTCRDRDVHSISVYETTRAAVLSV